MRRCLDELHSSPPPHAGWGDVATPLVPTQRSITIYNQTQRELMLVLAEEDFDLQPAARAGRFGAGAQWVSKSSGYALDPQRPVIRPNAGKKVTVSNGRGIYVKMFSKDPSSAADSSWEDATILLHYERTLGENQSEQTFAPHHLENVYAKIPGDGMGCRTMRAGKRKRKGGMGGEG